MSKSKEKPAKAPQVEAKVKDLKPKTQPKGGAVQAAREAAARLQI